MDRLAQGTEWLAGRRALVMGLGTRQGGVGVARFLAAAGAEVTVTDLRPAEQLAASLEQLAGTPVQLSLGGHREEDFRQAEIVVRNPGVPLDSPWLALAREHGATIEMEMSLFFRACPAPIIGVTGTKGKTSTSALCAAMLSAWHRDTVLAGNMGRSALAALDGIEVDTPVVIELSSWQLEGLAEHRLSPAIAVWTNVSEDHLNRYRSYDDYVDAKRQIARYQRPGDWFVLNRDDSVVWASRTVGAGRAVPFGREADDGDGAWLRDGRLLWRWAGQEQEIATIDELPVPGQHGAQNALAALAAAALAGAPLDRIRHGLLRAEPVEHRQELVATLDGVRYVNDTAATAPAAALAALDTFRGRPIVLIAGGSDKQINLAPFAQRAATETAAIVLLKGTATPGLEQLLRAAGAQEIRGPYDSMTEAVRQARQLARPGAVVLLSPGCASFGLFQDEFDRGRAFRAAVGALRDETEREAGS